MTFASSFDMLRLGGFRSTAADSYTIIGRRFRFRRNCGSRASPSAAGTGMQYTA